MPSCTNPRRLLCGAEIAHHEAGHVCAALHLGLAVNWVALRPEEFPCMQGYCCLHDSPLWQDRDTRLAFLFAGPAAQWRWRELTGRDLGGLEAMYAYEAEQQAWRGAVLLDAQQRVERLMRLPEFWRRVEALAAGLLARGRMEGAEARTRYRLAGW